MAGFEFESAEASLSRAMSLAPGDADVLRFMASLQANLGRLDEALDYLARAIASDPLEPRAYHNQSRYLLAAGRPEEALASVQKQMELAPAGFGSGQTLCRVYLALSQPEKALHVAIDEPVAVWRPWTSAMACYALDEPDESNQHLAELIKLHADDAAFQIAEVCAFRNEADAALEWLERAYQQRDPGLAEIQYFVAFANLRNKRRYKALLKKLNLA